MDDFIIILGMVKKDVIPEVNLTQKNIIKNNIVNALRTFTVITVFNVFILIIKLKGPLSVKGKGLL